MCCYRGPGMPDVCGLSMGSASTWQLLQSPCSRWYVAGRAEQSWVGQREERVVVCRAQSAGQELTWAVGEAIPVLVPLGQFC
jgi:hypothetical protein